MTNPYFIHQGTPFINASFIIVSGSDAVPFLNGLVTNDVTHLQDASIMYACMLSPQGRFLDTVFLWQTESGILIETHVMRVDEMMARLQKYKLRSDVKISRVPQETFLVLQSTQIIFPDLSLPDPRHKDLGYRSLLPGGDQAAEALTLFQDMAMLPIDYHRLRIGLRVADGILDMTPDKSIPLEFRLEEHNAIDWNKGCYVGQELTARTHHTGMVRKKTFAIQGTGLVQGASLIQDGVEVGQVLGVVGDMALALLRVEAVESGAQITCGGEGVTVV